MKVILNFIVFLFFVPLFLGAQDVKHTLSGQIKDQESGEDLISASVFVPSLGIGTVSNSYGYYSLTLPAGDFKIVYSYIGYSDTSIDVALHQNVTQHIELGSSASLMDVVEIVASKEEDNHHIESTSMGEIKIKIETIKKMPALLGEVDLIKSIQMLPGVQSIGEGSSGFYVRGGNADQNLVLLDEAPIYNASHLLGFFSSFNPDAIKDMQLYKGAIPANFGGRLSSVLDIRMKEGSSKKFGGSAGLGSIMSRLELEAPLGDRGSFMIAGRRSYLDVLVKLYRSVAKAEKNNGQKFFFYDLNAKANYRINNNNRFFVSGYLGRDVLKLPDEGFGVEWGNTTFTTRWNHLFSPKLFSNLTFYYSNYDYFLDFEEDITTFKWDSQLREISLKADFTAYLDPRNTLKFGAQVIRHRINPGIITISENGEITDDYKVQKNESYESAIYLNNTFDIGDRIKLDYGIRVSSIHNIGPQELYNLDPEFNVKDTTFIQKGVYNSYYNPEPRVGVKYSIDKRSSIKASYNRNVQYIQLASNGNSATPFDIWFSSSKLIKPQKADQYSLGYFRNFKNNSLEASVELFYKRYKDVIDFKDHAELLLNQNLEAELRTGIGRSYGVEVLLKKDVGRLTGWFGYTYSRAQRKINTINEDKWYNAKYDKSHDFSLILSYELTKRFTVSSNFVYSTGNAVTFPTGRYEWGGVIVPIYSERNGSRLPNYHRLDFSAILKSKKKLFGVIQSEWVFSVYNAYNRKNAFSINFVQDEINRDITYAEKKSVFSIVPAITYNAKF